MMLNHEQEKVVDSIDPFIFLLAGAGSGKTRVIVERIKRLVLQGVDPRKILAITFTRKASFEMKERLHMSEISVHTFHQFAYLILKEKWNHPFEMIDDHVLMNFTEDEQLQISKYKNSMYQLKKPRVYERYQEMLKAHQMLDFDDLLLELLQALKQDMSRVSYTYIFVDEFQDTNHLQYQLLKKIIRKNTHVFAVGDPDQSIYQFRGASSKIIDLFIKDYQAKIYLLTFNYRSDTHIITAANRLIKQNNRSYKKELKATHQETGTVKSIRFSNDEEEASCLIEQIKYLHHKKIRYNQIAFLYRNHDRAYHLILKLHESGIPFRLIDEDNEQNDGIHLLTIHQAKGLEFDVVVIIGCENNLLPSNRLNLKSAIEEERRLMFVAMTRARHELYLTHIVHNTENHHFTSSRFIRESGLKSIMHHTISDIISLGDHDGHKKTHGRTG